MLSSFGASQTDVHVEQLVEHSVVASHLLQPRIQLTLTHEHIQRLTLAAGVSAAATAATAAAPTSHRHVVNDAADAIVPERDMEMKLHEDEAEAAGGTRDGAPILSTDLHPSRTRWPHYEAVDVRLVGGLHAKCGHTRRGGVRAAT